MSGVEGCMSGGERVCEWERVDVVLGVREEGVGGGGLVLVLSWDLPVMVSLHVLVPRLAYCVITSALFWSSICCLGVKLFGMCTYGHVVCAAHHMQLLSCGCCKQS